MEAEVIATGGFGYDREFIEKLKVIADKRGIIILTDPDYAGEKIRKKTFVNILKTVNMPSCLKGRL